MRSCSSYLAFLLESVLPVREKLDERRTLSPDRRRVVRSFHAMLRFLY